MDNNGNVDKLGSPTAQDVIDRRAEADEDRRMDSQM